MRVLRNGNRMFIMAYCQRCGCMFEEERKKWFYADDTYTCKCPQCYMEVSVDREKAWDYPKPANEDPWEEE